MSAPLVINTTDGSCWTRRTVTSGGVALYALADVCSCPEFVMATLAELAERGIVGSADVLPMPVGPESQAPRPVSLTEEQIEKLTAAGNRAVNDLVHDDLCACDAWPGRCLSSGGFFQGYWDWGYLETAVRAVLGVWQSMRAGDRVTELEAALYTEQAQGRTLLEQRNAHAKELLKLRTRVAELEARLAEYERPADVPETALAQVQAVLLAHYDGLPRPDMAVGLLLTNLRAELLAAPTGDSYPPALPWAALLDHEDLTDFLDELAASAITHAPAETALAEVEKTCGTWRLIAEAQHAHNTAPGPNAEAGEAS
ncbi:hypothetical protein GCM10022384_07830 [Streptomyces marokkonensis]|uniref:Uncharacterized protein n=1 Tax=Streptomyces marokkonensis TaxID=324855 RepID=A0ABP7NZR9_9ACTN